MGSSVERHTWLEAARDECASLLAKVDCKVPANVRVTIGFPSTGGRGKRIGECVFAEGVSDEMHEVFVSPRLMDSVELMGVLIHELIHTAVGFEAKHGKEFKHPATAVGLEGKMTATTVGDALRETFQTWIAEHGEYPGGMVNMVERKKQKTRLLKAECEECGYICRVTQKWVDDVGPPHCPDHGAMTVEGMSETDPDEVREPLIDPDGDDGYRVVQDDPDQVRFQVFGEDERSAAEAKARQWSRTGTEKMAHVRAIKGGEEVGYKAFHAGLAGPSTTGDYPL